MERNKINEDQIKIIYESFKKYQSDRQRALEYAKQRLNDSNLKMNENSLLMYLNSLYHMVKGEIFKRAISQKAKNYFLKQIEQEFGSGTRELAEKSIKEHEAYLKEKQKQREKEINFSNERNKTDKPDDLFSIKNIILYGPPGTGKTVNYRRIIDYIELGQAIKEIFALVRENSLLQNEYAHYKKAEEENRIAFITFHQNFSYEDFIEGFRPNASGGIKLEKGIFKEICEKAQESNKPHYLIIDEINRGNISKIFGELITLIEEDKRGELTVTLPYSKEPFTVPENLYIIATMNSTDKSIALIDVALRRRFTFVKMMPNPELVENEAARKAMIELNSYIAEKLGEDFQIGHSYFMTDDLDFAIDYKIVPLLEEYFFADAEGLREAKRIVRRGEKQ